MKFVHSEILWALLALSIPVIVHLFNFRKFKKVMFSNVSFLKEIQQETKSKSKLKHLLILLARMFAMACIILAFAQPYIPLNDDQLKAGDKAVSIYIDNSFSTQSDGEGGSVLELEKSKAIELIEAHKPTDKFQVLTNDFEGRHQRLVNQEEAIQLVQEIAPSPAAKALSEVMARQQDLLISSPQASKMAYILSDLQGNMMDVDQVKADSSIRFHILPENAKVVANIAVDSVWFATPVRQLNVVEQLYVRLRNNGAEKKENLSINLKINGQQKSVGSASLEPYQTQEVELSFTNTEPGFKLAEIHVDDQPITFDNTYNFSFNVAQRINVLNIRGNLTADPVQVLFSDDPYFQTTTVAEGAIDFSAFGKADLIIVNQLQKISSGLASELEKFVSNGGSCVIIPATQIDLVSFNDLLQRCEAGTITGRMAFGMTPGNPVTAVNFDHYLLRGVLEKNSGNEKVAYPHVGDYYTLTMGSNGNVEPIMTLQSNDPFFISAKHGGGFIYCSAVSLQPTESNFIAHSFFPTLLLRMAEFAQNSDALSYTLGKELSVTLRNVTVNGEQTFKLVNKENGGQYIPEHRNAGGNTEIFFQNALTEAGNYLLNLGDSTITTLSFNFDRRESYTTPKSADDMLNALKSAGLNNVQLLKSDVESLGAIAGEITEGKKYWYSMIIWGLIFLAIEVLLIKFWK
jgi:hypothetical protein